MGFGLLVATWKLQRMPMVGGHISVCVGKAAKYAEASYLRDQSMYAAVQSMPMRGHTPAFSRRAHCDSHWEMLGQLRYLPTARIQCPVLTERMGVPGHFPNATGQCMECPIATFKSMSGNQVRTPQPVSSYAFPTRCPVLIRDSSGVATRCRLLK